jgi:predicted TIM-barrel fold metal-dependent hydrolase
VPLTDDIRIISVDDHVIEPPNVWVDRLPAKFQEAGPHIEKNANGTDDWVWEGRRYPVQLMGSPRTRHFKSDGTGEEVHSRGYDEMIEGCYDVHARMTDMDLDGVHAQLCFPTFPRFAGTRFLEANDKELGLLVVQAYNDWMIDEWCAAYPTRQIPMCLLPLWDIDLSVKEIHRVAGRGAKSISFPENPYPLGLPSFASLAWDPVFRAAAETGLPLSMHVGTSGALMFPSPDASQAVPISAVGTSSMLCTADLIFSGLVARNPTVKIALSEGGSGWVPYMLERMDYTWERTRFGIGIEKTVPPSQQFADCFWTCFISDQVAIDDRHLIGVNKLCYESDYPHNDSNWPDSRAHMVKQMVNVPTDEVKLMMETNARELYNFWD